ncbi:S24 family peptidase [Winogradskyella sp. 3972H.M.0a.05]|uniref:S24 family peptidase n=1 Tax=Winogradskyella sp. 3972H.M.0a.05 TaxID=2950277 RepID=UPI003396FCE8
MSDISNIFLRLKQIAELKGYNSINDFAKNGLGYKSSEKLNRLKHSSKKPSYEIIADISNKFEDINIRWFISGEGEITGNGNSVHEPNSSYRKTLDKELAIPLYDIESINGLDSLFENPKGYNPIDSIFIPGLPKCDGGIKVNGDSMYPLLKSGDIILYKQISDLQNDIFWGEMYLLSLATDDHEYITVKYIQPSQKGEEWLKLVSENQQHEDWDILRSRVKALALVKASIRINSMS